MAIRFSNTVQQNATYKTGSPDYISLSGLATSSFRTVQDAATGESWADGDRVGVRITQVADNGNYAVWTAVWVSATSRLNLDTEETAGGTLEDDDPVLITLTLTQDLLAEYVASPPSLVIVEESGTTHTVSVANAGKLHRMTSGSAVTITIPTTLPVGFWCSFMRRGAGTLAFARSGSDLVNGGSANIDGPDQYRLVTLVKDASGSVVIG